MSEFIDIDESQKEEYNAVVDHPLQSWEWGEFRKKTGVKIIRRALVENKKMSDGFTLSIHNIPKSPFSIGYFPKGKMPTRNVLEELKKIGKSENCIFIQLEPEIKTNDSSKTKLAQLGLTPSARPLFTKYSFVLNLSKSEQELLKMMHPKTRYNIKVAQKSGVKVIEDSTPQKFNEYLSLLTETEKRQKFYAHNRDYHKKLWETVDKKNNKNNLSYHLFHALYTTPDSKEKVITSWVLFVFHNKLYYPYGASSREYRQTMASNLIAWEAIKFGKKLGLTEFDMWGALGPTPNKKDPWYGFHRFKEGYGGELVEFVGSYDLVIKNKLYKTYKLVDKARWAYLNLRKLF